MNVALAFSGGKDSWACLWLNSDFLNDITVVWVNTGKNYPELLESVALAKSICPNFVEVKSNKDLQNSLYGLPADVVPIRFTKFGQSQSGNKPITIQPYISCCYENIALPLMNFCKDNGITTLIRGQRLDEGHKSTATDGSIVDGITFSQPIETWTSEEVIRFVEVHMDIPDHFRFKHSSMDCYDCTAYKSETSDVRGYAETTHPKLFAEYKLKDDAIKTVVLDSIKEYL